MLTLRPYQSTAVEEVRTALKSYRRVLFQLPTGGGKTVCFSYMAVSSQRYGRRVLILSSRTEILMQNGGSLERAGLSVQYIDPRMRGVPTSPVCVGMAQTLKRRVEKEEWREWLAGVDFLIIDEAHECVGDFIHGYVGDRAFVLGVTATPRRYGHQRQLGEMYRAMVVGVTVKELISLGYLSRARHFSVAAPKLDGVEVDYGTGDYNQRSLAARFEDKKLYTGIVEEYLRLAPRKKAIFFCCSSAQTVALTEELNLYGVSARYILSGSFDQDGEYSGSRQEIIGGFKRGEFQVLVNLGIAVAGFDVPDVEAVVLCFSTISLTKYLQAVGRGSRVAEGKDGFLILDAGENYRRHGSYDSDRIWSLWHDEKVGVGEVPMKLCDPGRKDVNGRFGCDTWVPMTCAYCPRCGYKFVTEKDEFQLHLEELADGGEEKDLVSWAAARKREGWKLSRIMVQTCLSNPDNPRDAFLKVYKALYPGKTAEEAGKYWYVWKKNVWSKMKRKSDPDAKLFGV
jgi:DNA repair protein RadD